MVSKSKIESEIADNKKILKRLEEMFIEFQKFNELRGIDGFSLYPYSREIFASTKVKDVEDDLKSEIEDKVVTIYHLEQDLKVML